MTEQEHFDRGVKIGNESKVVHISLNGVWSGDVAGNEPMTHTPGPWTAGLELPIVGDADTCKLWHGSTQIGSMQSSWIPREEQESNAEFVVRACNSHYDLLEACEAVIAECEAIFLDTDEMSDEWRALETKLRAAIAKAKGGNGAP